MLVVKLKYYSRLAIYSPKSSRLVLWCLVVEKLSLAPVHTPAVLYPCLNPFEFTSAQLEVTQLIRDPDGRRCYCLSQGSLCTSTGTRTWKKRMYAVSLFSTDMHPLKAYYKGQTAYTDKLERAHPGTFASCTATRSGPSAIRSPLRT